MEAFVQVRCYGPDSRLLLKQASEYNKNNTAIYTKA